MPHSPRSWGESAAVAPPRSACAGTIFPHRPPRLECQSTSQGWENLLLAELFAFPIPATAQAAKELAVKVVTRMIPVWYAMPEHPVGTTSALATTNLRKGGVGEPERRRDEHDCAPLRKVSPDLWVHPAEDEGVRCLRHPRLSGPSRSEATPRLLRVLFRKGGPLLAA